PEYPALTERVPMALNFGAGPVRVNGTQRPVRGPAEIQRLGHVVLGSTRFGAALNWYLDTLGLIVSDFLYLDGQRDRGPAMAFTGTRDPSVAVAAIKALREKGNEIDLAALRGLVKAISS